MARGFSIVDGFVPTAADDTNLRDDVWNFALDQRAFGPGKLLVAFADADGTFRAYREIFERARALAEEYDIRLLDWIVCDDDEFFANRIPLFHRDPAQRTPEALDWWDVPSRPRAPRPVPLAQHRRAQRSATRPAGRPRRAGRIR